MIESDGNRNTQIREVFTLYSGRCVIWSVKEEVRVTESYVRFYLEPPENKTLLTFLNTPGEKIGTFTIID